MQIAIKRMKIMFLKSSNKNFIFYLSTYNKIFCEVNKNFKLETLVYLSKRVWSDEQKFSSSNQNISRNQSKMQSTKLRFFLRIFCQAKNNNKLFFWFIKQVLGKLKICCDSNKILSVLYQQFGWLIQQFFSQYALQK